MPIRGGQGGRRHIRVRTLLALSVLVPLAAALYLVVDDVDHHRTVRAEADRIEAAAVSAQPLIAAQTALSVDARAASALSAVTGIGIDISTIVAGLDLDLATRLDLPRAAFDAALVEIESTPSDRWADSAAVDDFLRHAADIAVDRELIDSFETTPDDAARLQEGLVASLGTAARAQVLSLGDVDESVAGAGRLAGLAANAADAAAYVDAVLLQGQALITFLAIPGATDPVAALDAATRQADTEWRQLVDRLDPTTRAEFEAIRATPDFVELDALTAAILAGEERPALTIALPAVDLAQAVGELASDMTDQLVMDLVDEAARISDDATANERQSLVVGLIISVVTVGSVAAAAAMIVRPLRYLEGRAHRISAGDLDATPSGRLTLREAEVIDDAMDDMVRSLSVLERQAEALSTGRVDAESLRLSAPGRLGDSLRQSVDQLAELTSRLDHQARHDTLTGLPNRAAAMEAIDTALARRQRRGGHLALLFLDLDEFKRINDSLGHSTGDAVLLETATRLTAHSRDRDFVARLGGDEFVVIVDDLEDRRTALATAERIAEAMAAPIDVNGVSITSTASVGIGWTDDDVASAEELLNRADLATYQAKAHGRARVEVFDEDLQDADDHRRDVERRLRDALADDRLELWFQPIVRLPDRRPWGFEGLVRWRDRDGALHAPDEFIPIAEHSNLIVDLDRWVIGTALDTLAEWHGAPATADLRLAINVSARSLTGGRLGDELRHVRPPDRSLVNLGLEVTESGILRDIDAATTTLQDLAELGVGVAIDDFGTGHSSLARLRTLPVERLKVDRSYVQAADARSDRAILETLASLAMALEMEAVAEGIETEAQHDLVISLGYTHAQGFFYARPMPSEDIGPWLAARSRLGHPS